MACHILLRPPCLAVPGSAGLYFIGLGNELHMLHVHETMSGVAVYVDKGPRHHVA